MTQKESWKIGRSLKGRVERLGTRAQKVIEILVYLNQNDEVNSSPVVLHSIARGRRASNWFPTVRIIKVIVDLHHHYDQHDQVDTRQINDRATLSIFTMLRNRPKWDFFGAFWKLYMKQNVRIFHSRLCSLNNFIQLFIGCVQQEWRKNQSDQK